LRRNGLRPGWAVGIGLVGLFLIVAAHLPMQQQRMPAWAAAALLAGVVLWIFLAIRFPPHSPDPGPLEPPAGGPRIFLLAMSIVLAVLAWVHTAGGTYRLPGVAAWVAAASLWLLAWRPRRGRATSVVIPAEKRNRRLAAVGLAAVLLVGAGFLFYRLSETPGNPTSDHAEKLLDVLDLVNGQRPIFFVRNTGREPFQFYWTFALMEVFGLPLSYLTLKVGTAIIGLLALPALYLLGREMGGIPLGLSVAALAAWGKWPVALARQGLRYTLAVLPAAVVLWALLRYVRRGDRASVLWAGAAIGLGLHGYISFRAVPLLVPLALGFALFDSRRRGRRMSVVGDGLLIAATAVVVTLPLLRYTVEHPDQFWYRVATRIASLETPILQAPLAIFGRNVLRMLLAFDWRGASTWVVIRPGEPFLDVVTASFWVTGVVLLLVRIARRSPRWAIVALSFFVLTLPSTLSLAFPDENPSVNRIGTAIPVVFLVAGLPIAELVSRNRGRGASLAAGAGLAALLAFSLHQNFRDYFVGFHRNYDQTVDHAIAMARALDEYRRRGVPLGQMYLLGWDYGVDGRNIGLELGDPSWADGHIIMPGKTPPPTHARPLVFIFWPAAPNLDALRRIYPGGTERIVRQTFADRDFGVYFVPR
jgi:peptidoglycan/LPS O-acetylase OafA/YrhL